MDLQQRCGLTCRMAYRRYGHLPNYPIVHDMLTSGPLQGKHKILVQPVKVVDAVRGQQLVLFWFRCSDHHYTASVTLAQVWAKTAGEQLPGVFHVSTYRCNPCTEISLAIS